MKKNPYVDNFFKPQKELRTQARAKNYNVSQNKLMRKNRESVREIGKIPLPEHPSRRKSCEWDFKKYCITYHSEIFYLEFSADHEEVIAALQYAVLSGDFRAIAMSRGTGKTSLCSIAFEWGINYGHFKYGVLLAISDAKAADLLSDILSTYENNKKVKEDFPEICIPIEKLEGIRQRAAGQLHNGKPTGLEVKTHRIVFPTIEGSKASGIRIACHGLESKGLRGLVFRNKKGEQVRPDLCLIDDPQDNEIAASNGPDGQVAKREKLIMKTISKLGGPKKKLSCIMACTVIERNDLSDRFLDRDRHPEWQGLRMKLLYRFPDNMKLWDKYGEIRKEGYISGDKGKAATLFYKEHRKKMDEGSVPAWPPRFDPGEISGLQYAMNLYYEDKESFFSEYQNNPEEAKPTVFEINVPLITSRVNGFKRYVVPEQSNFLMAYADVNHIGLNYTVLASDNYFTSWIVDYGKHPEGKNNYLWNPNQASTTTEAQAIAAGIVAFVDMLVKHKPYARGASRVTPIIFIDANYMPETVCNTIAAVRRRYPGLVLFPDRGRGVKQYKPAKKDKIIGKAGNYFHVEKGNYGNQIVHCSDYWRMTAQKAFTLEVGVPGSCSLWGSDPRIHESFAGEVCSEKLLEFIVGNTRDFYDWYKLPGDANDKLDALVGCYVGAAFSGATLTGGERSWRPRRKKRARRKPKVSIIN